MIVENIMNRLTSLHRYTAIKKIDKGYSSDTKYVVTVNDTPYLYASPISHTKRKGGLNLLYYRT